ncbi:hypothetical protein [Deinococcus roseus]|uniref:Uncharacterized protein n=1 Tax=Deinococcus roseus TaxID=392414 RepID=A0ABQ2D292_9DEIO|nr:hypothetical protein [Deinococcus roseus]GGJ37548.1 hypothetical protein GCM10008938_24610 [Deinococcus roseus]
MLAPDHHLILDTLTGHLNLHHQMKLKLHALTTLQMNHQDILQQVKKDVLAAGLKLLPEFCMQTPRSFMDYTLHLERAVKNLRPAIQEAITHQGGIPTETQRHLLISEILKLKKNSDQQHLRHAELRKQLGQLLRPLRHHFLDFSALLEDSVGAQGEQQIQIEHLQTQLQRLMHKLGRDETEATPSSITFGTPVQGMALRLGFQHHGDTQTLSLGQLGITVASLGHPLGNPMLTPEVQKDLRTLNSGMQQLNLEQQMLVVSHGAMEFVKTLLQTIRQAEEHQASQVYLWSINSKLLEALLDTLSQPQIRVQGIKLMHSLLSSSPAWQQVSEFALQSQTTTHHSEMVTLPPVVLGAAVQLQHAH